MTLLSHYLLLIDEDFRSIEKKLVFCERAIASSEMGVDRWTKAQAIEFRQALERSKLRITHIQAVVQSDDDPGLADDLRSEIAQIDDLRRAVSIYSKFVAKWVVVSTA